MNDGLNRTLYNYLLKTGMGETSAVYLNLIILLVGAFVLAWLLDLIIWKILRSVSVRLAKKSTSNFDNFLPIFLIIFWPLCLILSWKFLNCPLTLAKFLGKRAYNRELPCRKIPENSSSNMAF